ncbi:MAG: hypothetical protein HQK63_11475 [Desulfamplus sp.]|nr:hypothetical protein [Desulfamplus sp.]
MQKESIITRIISRLFPTLEGKISGIIWSIFSINIFSACFFLAAYQFPDIKILFLTLSAILFIFSLIWAFQGIAILKIVFNEILVGIEKIFTYTSDGRIELSNHISTNHISQSDDTLVISSGIQKSYSDFSGRLREIIDKIRGIGLDTAIGATQIAAVAGVIAKQTANQKDLSETVLRASSEADCALKEVAISTQFVSEKTTNDLKMARTSYEELIDVTNKVNQINITVESFKETVQKLGQSSASILKVVSVINDIADMTSLLSLNATIEAARAGEHGKGFAVVAGEVRELANKIKPATQSISSNISEMIEVVKKTQDGTTEISGYSKDTSTAVSKAVENFNSMVIDFEKANDELIKIAAAIEELSTNNTDVTHKVQEIDSLTHEIAKEMAESEKSIQKLNSITEQMLDKVCSVKTGTGEFDKFISLCYQIRDVYAQNIKDIQNRGINVFDNNYKKVPDTNPQKYITSFSDAIIQKFQNLVDETLQKTGGAIYCLPIDKNGYLPVHHKQFSQPMSGDYKKDLPNSRHQKIYQNNSTEKRRCSHTERMLLQTYIRDTGQILNDLSMPIFIDGRHWGAMIIGFDSRTMFKDLDCCKWAS